MMRWCVAMLAVMSWFSMGVEAQSTSRLGRAQDRSKPRRSATDEARRRQQSDRVSAGRVRGDIRSRGLLRKQGGYYAYPPDRYRPDNWSPRIRPQYDYRIYRSDRDRAHGRTSPRRRFDSYYPRSSYGHGFGRSSRYDRGYGYVYRSYRDEFYSDAYAQGHYDADHDYTAYIAAQRAGQLLDANREKVDEGMGYFRAGDYARAAVAWLGASKLNQADAVSRIHAGHALFALGRYTDAAKLLEHGFELAPLLAESTYDIRTDYTDQSDFARHLATLKTYVARHPNDAEATTLLGYVLSYTEGPAAAYAVLARASALRPSDRFTKRLWDTAAVVTPQEGVEADDGRPARGPGATEPEPLVPDAPESEATEADSPQPVRPTGARDGARPGMHI